MHWNRRWNPRDAVAVVTGASRGIGNGLARQLSEQGANVIVVARRLQPLEQLACRQTGDSDPSRGRVIPVAGDITDAETRQQVVEAAASQKS